MFAIFLTIFYREITVKRIVSSGAAIIAKVKVAESELSSCYIESNELPSSKYE